MKNKKVIVSIAIVLVFIGILMCFITKIDVTKYTISNEKIPEEFNGFKIVQLSDFHSQGYRDTTEKLISKVKDINPDIIVMTGDMVSWDMEDIEEVEELSGKDKANIVKRQRRYQELQKEIEDMRKAIF